MNKRDEIRRAIETGIDGVNSPKGETERDEIVDSVMSELDDLVERWTDEETAEDLDKSITPEDVHEGMRVRIIHDNLGGRPDGATGTIIKDDRDNAPGVQFDAPNEHLNTLGYGTQTYLYTDLEKMEKLEDKE